MLEPRHQLPDEVEFDASQAGTESSTAQARLEARGGGKPQPNWQNRGHRAGQQPELVARRLQPNPIPADYLVV